jgi:hypothetical protein
METAAGSAMALLGSPRSSSGMRIRGSRPVSVHPIRHVPIIERRSVMPVLVQVCVVVVTIGLLATALLAVRRMTRFLDKAAADVSQLTLAVRESAARFDLATRDARTLVTTLQDCAAPVQRVVDRFETVGHRTADLSSALLEELELPVFTATAVTRGVRSGATHFLKRLMDRFDQRIPSNHGGHDHE